MPVREILLLALAVLALVAVSGFFSLAETALTESRKNRLEKLADDGDTRAEGALRSLEDKSAPLSVMQVGITLAGILIGVITGAWAWPALLQILPAFPCVETVAFLASVVPIAYLSLLFGEFLPKAIAVQDPEGYFLRYYKFLGHLEKLTRPFVHMLSGAAEFILLLLGVNPKAGSTVTEDEVIDLIEQGTEEGTFEKEEQDMVDRVFRLSDQTAYALMTPRTQLLWLDLADPLAENLRRVRESPATVFAVGFESLDNFRGVLYAKDLLNAALQKEPLDLSSLLKRPLFIPRSMESFRALEKFRERDTQEAMVLDEYGGIAGLLTLDDILGEIIGDSLDASEEDNAQITPRDENSWYMDGLYSIDDFKEKFDIEEPLPDEERSHFQTMGGFLTSYFGYIPKVAETCEWEAFRFEILQMDRARIDKVLVMRRKEGDKK